MNILVVNCGSSSIKAEVIDHESGKRLASMKVERIGEAAPGVAYDDGPTEGCAGADHRAALGATLPRLLGRLAAGATLAGVGHRVVHGGERFREPTPIDHEVEQAIRALFTLAPLHNPANLAGITAARELLGELPHVAVFDTAFHATLPRQARAYAIPTELAARLGVRRYGFHGTSHAYVAARAAKLLGEPLAKLRIITCHLGNGASMCAVEHGRSVETSMGTTPLEGLVMGTRSGDIDPGVVLHLMRREGLDVDGIDRLLNKESGLGGLSGVGNDMRDIEARAAAGDDRCQLALEVFCHRVRKYLGAYAAVMGGLDAVVLTAGIGENSPVVRGLILQGLELLGIDLDDARNREARVSHEQPAVVISAEQSRVKAVVVATDEQHAIAQEAAAVVARHGRGAGT
jgi:acetate kinase